MNKPEKSLLGGRPLGTTIKKRGALGKGLGALIPNKADRDKRNYFECLVSRIKATPDQPRSIFNEEALSELAESIKRSGIIQPLVVRQDGADYRLIAGERRLRASRLIGLERVPVVIKDVDPDEAFELALLENIQREDLNPVEEAEAYQRLMTMREYTQETLAESLGKSRSTIANTLRLLKLSEPVQRMIAKGELSSGAARAILSLPQSEDQERMAQAAIDEGFNVRQLESLSRRVKGGDNLEDAIKAEVSGEVAAPTPAPRPRKKSTSKASTQQGLPISEPIDITNRAQVVKSLSERFGCHVDVHDDEQGGSIEIYFDNEDHLKALVEKLMRLK